MSSGRYVVRRRAARTVLIVGALLQLLLISALPLFAMDAEAWQSFISLSAMVVISIGSAITLRRWSRESVTALGIGSLYAMIIITWTAIVTFRSLSTTAGPADPARIASLLLALGTFGTIPLAFALAWPLRLVAMGNDSPAVVTPDSQAARSNPPAVPRA